MKTLAIFKRQQFEDNRSDKSEPKGSKRQRLDECDNEEGNGLDEDEDKIEGARYILLPFVSLLPLPQKVSNRPSDLSEETRSLNHLVCIPKICYSRSAKLTLEFPGRGGSKAQKKTYTSCLREKLESHSASTAFIASGTTNHRRPIRERLESYPPFNYRQDLGTQLCTH